MIYLLNGYLGGSLTWAQKQGTPSGGSGAAALGPIVNFLKCNADVQETNWAGNMRRSYSIHTASGGRGLGGSGHSRRLSEIHDASGTILNLEQFHSYNNIGRGNHNHANSRHTWHIDETANGHGPYRFNFLFCDGHAKLMNTTETGGIQGDWGMWSVSPDD